MRHGGKILGGILFLTIFEGGPARADAIVVTRAMNASTVCELYVAESGVRAQLEIGVVDLVAFRNLLPEPLATRIGETTKPFEQRIEQFFLDDLTIRPDGGSPIAGHAVSLEVRPRVRRDEITGEPLPSVDADPEPVLFVELAYPFATRPTRLSISPPMGPSGYGAANVGFMAYHEGLPVNDFRYLGGVEELHLDWDDPWFSRFENRNLRRQFDSPVSAYIYVEPFEVRKEIVLRPRDLAPWLDLGLRTGGSILRAEQPELKRKVAEFLVGHLPLEIDGVAAEGFLDRIHFIHRSLKTSGVIDPPQDLPVNSATLGVIFAYPIDGLPERVSLEWDLFGERLSRVPAVATDEAGGLPFVITPEDPVMVWQNFLRNPTVPALVEILPPAPGSRRAVAVGSLLAAFAVLVLGLRREVAPRVKGRARGVAVAVLFLGAAASAVLALQPRALPDERADAIVSGLLENIYRAFDYRDESVIYDSLARSVDGDLLTDVYLETRRALELRNQGGARAKVREVQRVESEHRRQGRDGFASRFTWDVSGSVGHWGHVHQRSNRYQARLAVKAIDGAWKISELELLEEERLDGLPAAAPTAKR